MKTYEHVNNNPRWYERVTLSKRTTQTLGVYIGVLFEHEPASTPEFNVRLTDKQLHTITNSAAALRTQRTIDSSRDSVFRLLCCDQTITIVPHQLEQDTAPTLINQERQSCYSLVLDIIAKAMEKTYGI